MSLQQDIFEELENIVGAGNISIDPAVRQSYAYLGFGAAGPGAEDRFGILPEAVVLPADTAQIQAVVRICNTRGIKYKASSTGYGPFYALGAEGTIAVDLRRLNRILEIDEKNMFAAVEPYVTFAQLQAEAHKRGLNCHVIGGGSNCSVLANHTSVHGTNPQGISHGWSGRNLLGVEWILPDGDLVTLGSVKAGSGWFSGDGPGPSLRGIMRGAAGALGGLGIFTKCAVHLHPWPGPDKLPVTGTSPAYETDVPPLFEYYIIEWPDWEHCSDGLLKIGEAGIALATHKTGGPGSNGTIVTTSNNDYWERWQDTPQYQLPWVSFALVLGAGSEEEHKFQKKVLDKILEDTGGKILPVSYSPIFRNRDFLNMIKMCFIPRYYARSAGAFIISVTAMDTIDHAMATLKWERDLRQKYDDRGMLFNDGTNTMWGGSFEGSHFGVCEGGQLINSFSAEAFQSAGELIADAMQRELTTPTALAWNVVTEPAVKQLGPRISNFHTWMRRIKKTLDPNGACDASGYISAEE